jgi:hypothetical protein
MEGDYTFRPERHPLVYKYGVTKSGIGEVHGPFFDDSLAAIHTVRVINTLDEAIRRTLIELGWTPPPDNPPDPQSAAVSEADAIERLHQQ